MDQNDFNDLLKIQRMMASRLMEESTVDDKIKLLDVINRLVTDRNRKVQKETVLVQAQEEGFSEEEALRLLDTLLDDKLVIEPEPGYVKRA
ncbi:hypothetical protein KY327_01305 [Candidatus Woesearchaeota archaeon]|nr:hypothetical protein [Candidatus Woesearchaeota archaeon]